MEGSAIAAWTYRIGFLLAAVAIIFFNGNYRNIRRVLPPAQHKNPLIRWVVLLMVDLAFFALWVLFFDMLPAAILS